MKTNQKEENKKLEDAIRVEKFFWMDISDIKHSLLWLKNNGL